jgi:hypothetical protein
MKLSRCLFLAAVSITVLLLLMTPSPAAVQGTSASMDSSYDNAVAVMQPLKKKMQEQEIGPLAKHEPYMNRWDQRFASSAARGKLGGYVFFKHIRKAGGTTLRAYIRNVFEHRGLSRDVSDYEQMITNQTNLNFRNKYDISYVESEFVPLDWKCSAIDPRWQVSLNIIVLRHPIERHMSEFFFSGINPAAKQKFFGSQRIIQKGQLSNKTYTDILAKFIAQEVPYWTEHSRSDRMESVREKRSGAIFERWYQDNFQLRALAGCSSGACLEKKLAEQRREGKSIHELHPLNQSYATPKAMCTQFFQKDKKVLLFDNCSGKRVEPCSRGCDGPCFYPTIAEGTLDQDDVMRAITALKAFDAILLMEKLSDDDQSTFLNDIMGVPRDASFALKRMRKMNARVIKRNEREVTHFYRDLLTELNLKRLLDRLEEENKFEIEFFHRAVELHDRQMNEWKIETGWKGGE